jgi:hypothetical protein
LLAKGKKKSRHVSSLVSISMDLLKTLWWRNLDGTYILSLSTLSYVFDALWSSNKTNILGAVPAYDDKIIKKQNKKQNKKQFVKMKMKMKK